MGLINPPSRTLHVFRCGPIPSKLAKPQEDDLQPHVRLMWIHPHIRRNTLEHKQLPSSQARKLKKRPEVVAASQLSRDGASIKR